ncbi:hypothetical protein OK016_19405 [Vibrio chagasii]|nr:hypothetical protein [Vibrio chagasii]
MSLSADASVTEGAKRTSPTRRHWTKSCGWRGDGDANTQRSLSLRWRDSPGTKVTTVPASDDVYVGGDTASATITDATGATSRAW